MVRRGRVLALANRPGRRGFAPQRPSEFRRGDFGRELNFLIAARNQTEFFAGVRCRTAEPPFFQPRANDPRRRNHETKTKNSKASRDTAPVVRSGTRVLPSREALLFQKMNKTIKPQNGTLDAVMTAQAKREAQRHGVLNGNRVTLDLEPKTAAALRAAAEFEEMSVEEYLMDGLKRDLDLSADLMATAKT